MSMRLPDFIIGGAPRSGTTWLYHLLSLHPGIFMARPVKPEPKFFLIDEQYREGLGYYSSKWFRDCPAGKIAGEKSTNYLESPEAARRILKDLPDVKMVFIFREPAVRAYSNYLWTKMNGLETESFGRALELEEQRERTLPERLKYARPYSYFSRGLYAGLIGPYLELGRERILCLRCEDIAQRPGELAARLHRFLGVEPRPGDAGSLGVVNAATGEDEPAPEHLMSALRKRYRAHNERFYRLIGGDFEPWE